MGNNKEIAVKVNNLTKSFKVPLESHSGVKQKLINTLKGRKGYRDFTPLKDLSFEIEKGDFFGIVGRNGSGKSTLLKTLAGIYTPNKGSVEINGNLVPFIELGVGFNPELTGRENVFLNGALLGFSRSKMELMYEEIVDFAELEDFMDERLKNYSSGMQVRLAFSIAIRADADILLLDEVLAVGDAAFQQKCYDYFSSLKRDKKTVILVSHSMSAIERFCNKALLIEKGRIVKYGKSKDIATLYENLFLDDANSSSQKVKSESTEKNGDIQKKKPSSIQIIATVEQDNKKVKGVAAFKEFSIDLSIISKIEVKSLNVGLNIRNAEGTIVFSDDMRRRYKVLHVGRDSACKIKFTIENIYTNGTYVIDVVCVDEDSVGEKILYSQSDLASFEIFGVREHIHSLVHPDVTIKVEDSATYDK